MSSSKKIICNVLKFSKTEDDLLDEISSAPIPLELLQKVYELNSSDPLYDGYYFTEKEYLALKSYFDFSPDFKIYDYQLERNFSEEE